MNRTPLLGAPARAVVSYRSVVKFHSNVLPTNSGGKSAAPALPLVCVRGSRLKIRAASIRRAYGSSRVEWCSGFVAAANARAGTGAEPAGLIDAETDDKLCNGAALKIGPIAASSAAVA